MKLASYHGTRAGILGLGNILIRLRLRGIYSHSEIVFEPGDGVDALMPDGTCEPDADGALWCVSSTGLEHIPPWSPRRAGKRGGVRFKRIVIKPDHWQLDDMPGAQAAATWAVLNEGGCTTGNSSWAFGLGGSQQAQPRDVQRGLCRDAGPAGRLAL